jgi:UDP-4-amino-4,6-dideoxy-N-acetyl-beta-L-altrosamine transaminase
MIPYGRHDITEDDVRAVSEVMRSDWLTQGPAVPRFEQEVAAICGARHAVAVNSATSALHIACMALDVGPGDWVWTSPNTFLASANCARYCGAEVDFVDIDPCTYNLSAVTLAEKLERAQSQGRLPKVVIAVHFAGQSCEMCEIKTLGERYGFRIIEDASHAVGGSYHGDPVGSCRFSDIAVFSFHPVKLITTAEGGMALTNDAGLAARMERYRSHGMTRDPALMEGPSDGPWYYQQIELGYNYRLTDIQAVLGLSQLQRLSRYVEQRHAIAQRYGSRLAGLPLVLPYQSPDARSALHLYPVQVADARQRRRVFDGLRAAGVGVNVHYIPVHLQPYYRLRGHVVGECPHAEAYYERAVSLPMFAALNEVQQEHVVSTLGELLR